MARISVTTDEGTVVEVWTDDEIGDLTKPMNASRVVKEIARRVALARQGDKYCTICHRPGATHEDVRGLFHAKCVTGDE